MLDYKGCNSILVAFYDPFCIVKCAYGQLKDGRVSNPILPNVFNKGYLGVGSYNSVTHERLYYIWRSMLDRVYNDKRHLKQPTYRDVEVCKEWLCFQNFAEWCYNQKFFNVTDFNGEPYELDKDILVRGNKTYSPETCCFVPKGINNLFKFSNRQNKKNQLGVYFKKSLNKYGASYKDSEGKHHHIGYFNNQIDAFYAYKVVKESTIKDVAVKYKDFIDQRTYEAMVGWEVTLKD